MRRCCDAQDTYDMYSWETTMQLVSIVSPLPRLFVSLQQENAKIHNRAIIEQ